MKTSHSKNSSYKTQQRLYVIATVLLLFTSPLLSPYVSERFVVLLMLLMISALFLGLRSFPGRAYILLEFLISLAWIVSASFSLTTYYLSSDKTLDLGILVLLILSIIFLLSFYRAIRNVINGIYK